MSAKKMILIPQEIFNNYMAQQELNNVPSYLNQLSNKANDVLTHPNLSSDAKSALYDQMFQQYRSMRNQQLHTPFAVEIKETKPVPVKKMIKREQTIDTPDMENIFVTPPSGKKARQKLRLGVEDEPAQRNSPKQLKKKIKSKTVQYDSDMLNKLLSDLPEKRQSRTLFTEQKYN